jgi:hypothetical protein
MRTSTARRERWLRLLDRLILGPAPAPVSRPVVPAPVTGYPIARPPGRP